VERISKSAANNLQLVFNPGIGPLAQIKTENSSLAAVYSHAKKGWAGGGGAADPDKKFIFAPKNKSL
jgi:hypothetical protein